MSWSFSAVGRPAKVAAACRDAIENGYKCAEPEETIRKNTLATAATSAEAHKSDNVVRVEASGSMYVQHGEVLSNVVRLDVSNIHGFIE